MSKQTNQDRFIERIETVCRYIDLHLDEELTLDRLCSIAHFSKYHFHRLFSAYMGISLHQYIQKIRLKRAAYRLVFSQDKSILEIALESGFEYQESFTRAFKKYFQQSPSEFRQQPDWHGWSSFHHRIESCQGMTIRVDVIEIADIPLAVMEHCGAPTLLIETIGRFTQWRQSVGSMMAPDGRSFGIVYNDPHSVLPEDFRFDVAVEINQPVSENAFGVLNKTLLGGRYAVTCHLGSRALISNTVYYLYQQWLVESGEVLRDAPVFFQYLNHFPDVTENELKTNVYLPIQ